MFEIRKEGVCVRVCMHVRGYVFTARHDPGNVGERIGVTLQVRLSEQAPCRHPCGHSIADCYLNPLVFASLNVTLNQSQSSA